MPIDSGEPDPVRGSLQTALGAGYRIVRLLGRGGMGAVYLARDESLERLVAVKALSLERGLDHPSRERFRREARMAARLTHPNIVPLYAFGEADGMMYLVMGYVPGESLAARLRREGRLGIAESRRIVADVADALDHAHRQGVIHRDVKPDNVLIDDESGRALLADFGIARALGGGDAVTRAGAVIGTPRFMSPEQASGTEQIDGRSDLYSLGAVAYTLLAGRPPFEAGDARDVLVKHVTQEPPPLRGFRPDVPDDLALAVMRCLAKDPAARWPDARALREAIAPTGSGDEELPEPLDSLDGRALILLALLFIFASAIWYKWLTAAPLMSAAGVVAVVSGAVVLLLQLPSLAWAAGLARQRGFSWSQICGALLRQPTWWRTFWPRRFRRAGDVWDRLPRPFRWCRVSVTLLFADALLFMGLISTSLAVHQSPGGPLEHKMVLDVTAVLFRLAMLVFPVLVLASVVSSAIGVYFVRALGLDVYQRRRVASALFSGPTSSQPLWKRPEVARALLSPRAPAAAPAEPRQPREFALALARKAAARTGEARRELEWAAEAARALAAEIEALDADVARLAADADTEEAARLRQRIEALGPESPTEGDERRELRRLLAQQAGLLAKLAERLDAARAKRAERVGALRTLWRRSTSDEAPTQTEAPTRSETTPQA